MNIVVVLFQDFFHGFLTERSKIKAYFHLISHDTFSVEEDLLAFSTHNSSQSSGVTDGGPGVFQQTTDQIDCWGLCKSAVGFLPEIQKKHWCARDLTGVTWGQRLFWVSRFINLRIPHRLSKNMNMHINGLVSCFCIKTWVGHSGAQGERLANPSHPMFPHLPVLTSAIDTCSCVQSQGL